MPDLSIIMPCYNRAHDLARTLEAYDLQRGAAPFELIAVDDASTDATAQVLHAFEPRRYSLRVERLERNSGPAAARNHGISLAQAPLLLIVGDDIRPAEDLIEGHLAAHRFYRDETAAILGRVAWPDDLPVNTLMAHIDGVGAQQFSYHYMRDGQAYDFRHFYTANISLKRDFLLAQARVDRLFDTDFPYAAFEDAELAYRMSKRGLRILYFSHLVGYHYHYHTIWTFARRQRSTGKMANLLTAKHPDLRVKFRAQTYRLLALLKRPGTLLSSTVPGFVEQLETLTFRLLDEYEWRCENPLLDWLYMPVLDHFYYDGYIQGRFKDSRLKDRLRQAHARCYLLPALKTFIRESAYLGHPLPQAESFNLFMARN